MGQSGYKASPDGEKLIFPFLYHKSVAESEYTQTFFFLLQ